MCHMYYIYLSKVCGSAHFFGALYKSTTLDEKNSSLPALPSLISGLVVSRAIFNMTKLCFAT